MDSVNNAVNTVLAMRDAQTVDQVQATLLKKVLNMQSQTVATLMAPFRPWPWPGRHAGLAGQYARLNTRPAAPACPCDACRIPTQQWLRGVLQLASARIDIGPITMACTAWSTRTTRLNSD